MFGDELDKAFTDHTQWEPLPTNTRDGLSRAFATLAHNGAGVHWLTYSTHMKHPSRLLGLLDREAPDDVPEQLLADPPCMLDGFSEAFLREFDTSDKLRSSKARAVLIGLCFVFRLDTLPLECRCAFILRIQRLSSRTNTQTFSDAAASFLLARQRLLDTWPGVRPVSKGPHGSRRSDPSADPGTADVVEGQGGKPKGVVGGGPWRTHISDWLNEKLGEERLDFCKAAELYREISIEGGERWYDLITRGR